MQNHKVHTLTPPDININGTQIKNTKQEKFLGVIIDNNLTWHIVK